MVDKTYAVEFETVADGKVIHIPDDYPEFESKNVRVIIMMDSIGIEKKKRIPGTAKGKIVVADDFDQPLDEESAEIPNTQKSKWPVQCIGDRGRKQKSFTFSSISKYAAFFDGFQHQG